MLFDISGRRHTVVRAVYGGLAVVFLAGFIGFGVGSDVSDGLFGSGHGGFHHRGAVSLDDQRDRLQRAVETRPGDARVWRQLSLLEAQAAYQPSPHHGGAPVLAPDGRRHLNESVSAYERYRDLVGRRRVDRVAGQTAARSYAALGLVRDAIDAQWLVTSRRDVAGHFLVAQLAAASGDNSRASDASGASGRDAGRGGPTEGAASAAAATGGHGPAASRRASAVGARRVGGDTA